MNSNKIDNFDKITEVLKPYLRRYLEERGVEITDRGQFSCLDPQHDDANPSCGFVKGSNEEIFHCFSCGAKGNIFHAAHYLENRPLFGRGFVYDNLIYLAQKYKIEYSMSEMTEEELRVYKAYGAYEAAAEIISKRQPEQYIMIRGWGADICRELQIGTVESYEHFSIEMQMLGFDEYFLRDVDLCRAIFNETSLIFAVRDCYGRVVGFAARNMSHSKESKQSKFINTSGRCPIYNKSVILYGLDHALQAPVPLYIVEGYPDVVTAYKMGMKNICAIGGTAMTQSHITMLKEHKVQDVIIALDGDESGRAKTQKIVDDILNSEEDIRIRILKLPSTIGLQDPDEYIASHGVDKFKQLPMLTPFQWRLEQFPYDTPPHVICDKSLPLILNDPNEVHREAMAKQLSDHTGIRLKTVLRQLDKLINAEASKRDVQIKARLKQMQEDILYDRGDPSYVLEMAANDIRQITMVSGSDTHGTDEVITAIDILKEELANRQPGLQGWKTGFNQLDHHTSGIPKQDAMITFAGDSNVGKCLKYDTEILLSDGSYKKIEDVCRSRDAGIIKMNNHKLIPGNVSDWVDSGDLECYRVTTSSGLFTEVSATHPYYTLRGWITAEQLKPEDKIAVASNYACFENIDSDLSLAQAEFIGMILADGGITREVRFTKDNSQLVDRFCYLSSILFPGCQIRKENITYYITDKERVNNRAMEWLRSLGLLGCNSHEKFIPDIIFKSSKDKIARFLGAFYACDGWVCRPGGSGIEIGISLCNQVLVRQIRSLLLRYGVKVKIKSSTSMCLGNIFNRFTIAIHDYDNAFKFYDHIIITSSGKQSILEEYITSSIPYRGAYGDNMPCELWGVIKDKCLSAGMTMAQLIEISDPDMVCIYFCNIRNKYRRKIQVPNKTTGIKRGMLKKIAYVLSDPFLISLANGDIYFDKIITVQPIGKHRCYDLTVLDDHNFIANDTVVHNSGFMFQLALNMAKFNDGITALFMSIDDSRQQALERFVAMESGLKIKQVAHPTEHVTSDIDREKLERGWASIRRLVSDNRLLIKDNTHGNTLDFAEGWIRWAKDNLPNNGIVFFLDNFHKLGDEANKDERVRFKHASARIHAMKNKLHITAICTMEIRKLLGAAKTSRPCLQDISESKSMEYDNNMIGMIYSEFHSKRQDAKVFWSDSVDGETVRKPVLEIDIQKNKISSFKGILYYKFNPECSSFDECNQMEIAGFTSEYTKETIRVHDKINPDAGAPPSVPMSMFGVGENCEHFD